jgi:molybdopterin converting factor small subunit
MAVTVKLPTQLRASAGGQSAVASAGATVGEVLDGVYGEHPELRDRICGDDGELRRFVNVYVGGEDIRYLDGLQTPVGEGGEVQILPAVAGG